MAWHLCDVQRVGPAEDGAVYIGLDERDDSAFQGWRWFKAIDAMKREMLATSLTALSTGLPVTVALAEPPDEYTVVNRLYVTRNP